MSPGPFGNKTARETEEIPLQFRGLKSGRQDLNLRPLGPESASGESAPVHTEPHPLANLVKTEGFEASGVHTASQEVHANSPSLSPPCPREQLTELFTSERLLTVGEVAHLLGVCRATAYRLVEIGKLPHLRIVNSIRIRAEDLQLLRRNRSGPRLRSMRRRETRTECQTLSS